jgi:hypothetical protein
MMNGISHPQHFYVKEKPAYAIQFSDVEAMKEKFANYLLILVGLGKEKLISKS